MEPAPGCDQGVGRPSRVRRLRPSRPVEPGFHPGAPRPRPSPATRALGARSAAHPESAAANAPDVPAAVDCCAPIRVPRLEQRSQLRTVARPAVEVGWRDRSDSASLHLGESNPISLTVIHSHTIGRRMYANTQRNVDRSAAGIAFCSVQVRASSGPAGDCGWRGSGPRPAPEAPGGWRRAPSPRRSAAADRSDR